jgi:hypothetical protein
MGKRGRKEGEKYVFISGRPFLTFTGNHHCRCTKHCSAGCQVYHMETANALFSTDTLHRAAGGGAVVCVLVLPKLVAKMFRIRKLKKKIFQLQNSVATLERREEKKDAQ